MRRLCFCLILSLLILPAAKAEAKGLGFVKARDVLAWCSAVPVGDTCRGYVLAVADVLESGQAIGGHKACFSLGTRGEDLVKAVVNNRNLLLDNPFGRAEDGIARLLAAAYPCGKD